MRVSVVLGVKCCAEKKSLFKRSSFAKESASKSDVLFLKEQSRRTNWEQLRSTVVVKQVA